MVATSCNPSKLTYLQELGNIIPQQLDVRAGDQGIQARVNEILSIVGQINVLVNNAGYIQEGAIEECRYVLHFPHSLTR